MELCLFNVYCDESCYFEYDGVFVMVWGVVYCLVDVSCVIFEVVWMLKVEYGFVYDFEVKWIKVLLVKVDFYLVLIDLFLNDEWFWFCGFVVLDKGLLDYVCFD